MSVRNVISRSDVWAEVTSEHLNAERRRDANASKEHLMGEQCNRAFIRAPYETGEANPRKFLINELDRFKTYIDEAITLADANPTVIALETKGTTSLWAKARKRIDGDNYYKNEESSGVTVIMMNVMVRNGENRPAFIDIQSIIDNDLDGVPNLPENFGKLLKNNQVMLVGEKVGKHIQRIENSFFARLDFVLYTTVEDITERVLGHKRERYDHIYDVHINPNRNSGLLTNFHEIFPNQTFFKNPYEVFADWSDLSELRDSQIKHALNKIWFTAVLVEKALVYFSGWNLSLSIMGTLYPICREEVRIDFHLKNSIDYQQQPPKWYQEVLWPCGPMQIRGDLSRSTCVGDTDQIRLDQEEEEKKRRAKTSKSEARKRKLIESDVSDNEDADHAHLGRQIADGKTKRRGEQAARTLRVRCTEENMASLLGRDDDNDDVLFVATVIQNMGDMSGKRNLKKIFEFFGATTYGGAEPGRKWPDERKEKLVNLLARDGFFARSPVSTPFSAMGRMNLLPSGFKFLLQMNVDGNTLAEYLAKLSPSSIRHILNGLESYWALPLDERNVQLESCPFYVRANFFSYLFDDDKIFEWIAAICRRCGMSPGDEFFRHRRPGYINQIIEAGRQGFITSQNAALMVAKHVGDDEDYDERGDAVLMCARWPALADLLHERWRLYNFVRKVSFCDPNLKSNIECRHNFHAEQTETEVVFISSPADVDSAKSSLDREDLIILKCYDNKNPRSFDINPALISFRAPGRDVYAFFPHEIDESLRDDLYRFLAGKTLFLRFPDTVKKWLLNSGDQWKIVNLAKLGDKYNFGRSNDSIAFHVWGFRFCIVTQDEWMTYPLSDPQKYHVAYTMNMLDELVRKLGLDVVMQNVVVKKKVVGNNAVEFKQ